jgi:hypothetical protein
MEKNVKKPPLVSPLNHARDKVYEPYKAYRNDRLKIVKQKKGIAKVINA